MPDLSLRILINLFLLFGALFAVWKGGAAERTSAGVVVINVAIGMIGQWLAPQSEDLIRLINDGLAAVALLVVTLRFGAPWMGGVMLFFAAQFAFHSYYLVTAQPETDYLSALINNLNWTGITWCLIIGTAMAWRRRLREARAIEVAA